MAAAAPDPTALLLRAPTVVSGAAALSVARLGPKPVRLPRSPEEAATRLVNLVARITRPHPVKQINEAVWMLDAPQYPPPPKLWSTALYRVPRKCSMDNTLRYIWRVAELAVRRPHIEALLRSRPRAEAVRPIIDRQGRRIPPEELWALRWGTFERIAGPIGRYRNAPDRFHAWDLSIPEVRDKLFGLVALAEAYEAHLRWLHLAETAWALGLDAANVPLRVVDVPGVPRALLPVPPTPTVALENVAFAVARGRGRARTRTAGGVQVDEPRPQPRRITRQRRRDAVGWLVDLAEGRLPRPKRVQAQELGRALVALFFPLPEPDLPLWRGSGPDALTPWAPGTRGEDTFETLQVVCAGGGIPLFASGCGDREARRVSWARVPTFGERALEAERKLRALLDRGVFGTAKVWVDRAFQLTSLEVRDAIPRDVALALAQAEAAERDALAGAAFNMVASTAMGLATGGPVGAVAGMLAGAAGLVAAASELSGSRTLRVAFPGARVLDPPCTSAALSPAQAQDLAASLLEELDPTAMPRTARDYGGYTRGGPQAPGPMRQEPKPERKGGSRALLFLLGVGAVAALAAKRKE